MRKPNLWVALLSSTFFLSAIPAGAQQQPPSAYSVQLISYNSAPFGVCQIYQVALNVSTNDFYICSPVTHTWVIFSANLLAANNAFTGNNTHSGTETFANVNNVRFVDGVKFAKTAQGIQAALADLPTGGGIVDARGMDGAQSGTATVTIGANQILLLGAIIYTCSTSPCFLLNGSNAGLIGLDASQSNSTFGATRIQSAAGVTGISISGSNEFVLKNLHLISSSTVAGTDDGVQVSGSSGYGTIENVTVEVYGRDGFRFDASGVGANLDGMYTKQLRSLLVKGDGFHWLSGTDNNIQVHIEPDASSSGGKGFNLDTGGNHANTFINPHAASNTGGNYVMNAGQGNIFIHPYSETGTGNSFILGASAIGTVVYFTDFGQPATITDNGTRSEIWSVQGTIRSVNKLAVGSGSAITSSGSGGTVATIAGTETLSAKTFTAPIITGTAPYQRLRANQGTALVAGDFGSLTGWGSTASVLGVAGTDSAFTFTVSATGTGQAANPSLSFTFHDGAFANAPVIVCMRGPDSSAPTSATWSTSLIATNTVTLVLNGTPVASNLYVAQCIIIGK